MNWVRRVGRLPGARAASGRITRWIVGNGVVQGVARRVLAVSPHHVVPSSVAAGNVLRGRTDDLPVVLVVVIGASETAAGEVVKDVADIQARTAGFRPVFVADTAALGAARKYRYPAELLVHSDAWDDAAQGGTPWRAYVMQKLARVFSTYGATASVTLGSDGLNDAARLVLEALRPASD